MDTRTFAWKKTTGSDSRGDRKAQSIFVSQVVKSGRNPHEDRITVGRRLDNDIVIPHPSVSKLHAYFQHDPGDNVWKLHDFAASYGTDIQGMAVNRGASCSVRSGDVIRFAGSVQATFLTAPDFFEYLQLL